jgi:hypothetical protein
MLVMGSAKECVLSRQVQQDSESDKTADFLGFTSSGRWPITARWHDRAMVLYVGYFKAGYILEPFVNRNR